jgi:hypothetical protein
MVEQRRQLEDTVGGLVALEPEIANYLARVSPDNRRRLREVAIGMSPQQQQEFLASMQMGDIRFQSDVMPYMPEGADLIDPLVARLHGVPSNDAPDPVFSKEGSQINPRGLLGRYVSKFWEGDPEKLGRDSVYKRGKSGRFYGFPLESDTVNIYESSAANPQIWAHEYRHRQDLEGGRGEFGVKEILNRTQDVINANNPRDLRQALAPLAGTLADWSSAFAFKRNRRNLIIRGVSEFPKELDGQINEFQQYMQEVLDDSLNPDVPHAKLVEHAKNILNSKFIQNEFEANEVRASSYDKRRTPTNEAYAELPPLKERMTREDFREGRIYKDEIDTSFFDRFSNGGLVERRQLEDTVGGIDPQYDYGLPGDETRSLLYQFWNPFVPYRWPVERETGVKPISDEVNVRVDPMTGQTIYETPAEVDPGQYGEPEFGLEHMPVVRGAKAGLEFFGDLVMDPETRQRAADVMRSAPAEIIRQEKLRAGAASMGLENIRDPRSGEVLSTAETVLLAPAGAAFGTTQSLARLTPDQRRGTILGTMGGKGGPEESPLRISTSEFMDLVDGGLNTEHPSIGENLQKWSFDIDPVALAKVVSDPDYESYLADAQRIARKALGDEFKVYRVAGRYGTGETKPISNVGSAVVSSSFLRPSGADIEGLVTQEATISPSDVVAFGHSPEGEILVRDDVFSGIIASVRETVTPSGDEDNRIHFLRERLRSLTGNLEKDTTMPLASRRKTEREVREFSEELRERLASLESESPSKIQAYHGSHADFDEFSSDYIGTGEGAQSYGYGHYLAEKEDVARNYRDRLARYPTATDENSLGKDLVDNYHYGNFDVLEEELDLLDFEKDIILGGGEHRIIYKFVDNSGIEIDVKKLDETGNLDSSLRPIDLSSGAHMYQVDIDVKPEELLDWDLPISQQSQFVKDRMRELAQDGNPVANEFVAGAEGISPHLDQRMDLIYDKMAKGSDGWDFPGASETFKNAGIKGIRYKDGFSRLLLGGGSSNYVIFDGRLITISKKYGVAIPIAAAMLAKETGQDPTSFYSEDNLVQQKAQGGPVGGLDVYFSKMQMQGA